MKENKKKRVILLIFCYFAFIFLMFSGNILNSINLQITNKAPYLSFTTGNASTSIGISFQTPQICITSVYVGTNDSYSDFVKTDSIASSIHHFNFTGLEPETTYHYIINSSTCNLAYMNRDFTFKTAPTSANPHFSFTVSADTRPDIFGYSGQRIIMSKMIELNPDFMINVGDIVLTSTREDHWQRYFNCITMNDYASTHPYMVSIGNHETIEWGGDLGVRYSEFMLFPYKELYYAYNYSNTCFISLDLDIGSYLNRHVISQEQINWLNQTLIQANSSKNINWIIASWHVPPFSSIGDNEEIKAKIIPLIEMYKVDLVICAHHHDYERFEINGIPYIVNGGGGAELEPFILSRHGDSLIARSTFEFCQVQIDGNQLRVNTIDQNGVVFDTLNIIQDNPWRL
ncbi:MAG: metallophosphoesterase [Candidatus Helarchaeota archaeon]